MTSPDSLVRVIPAEPEGTHWRYHCQLCGSKGMRVWPRRHAEAAGEAHRKRCPYGVGSYFRGGRL